MEEDKRFSHVVSDPKFRHVPKASKKVKIDERFQSMFKDEKFNVNYTVDKRGRPVSHTTKEDLIRYYDLSSGESDDEENSEKVVGKFVRAPKNDETSHTETSELFTKNISDKKVTEDVKNKLKNLNIDYARGDSKLFSDSSSDDEESEDAESDSEVSEHHWGELDADAESTEEVTHRLAACNMDWDKIRAVDLMVLINSFIPSGGMVKSVAIYPSEFGKKRLQEEEIRGPIELVESNQNTDDNNEENEEGSSYHMEKLRKYQLNRLKYYYAVISFDSAVTANKVYCECDGMEYESSATKLDLRFIPDDMEFDDEPKEICAKLPDLSKYQPRFFTTTALNQAKVDLTWDETNPDRLEFAQKLNSGDLDNLAVADLQNYIAYSSGEESDGEPTPQNLDNNNKSSSSVNKYHALLDEIKENEKKKQEKGIQMEIKWDINLKEKSEKLVQKKIEESETKTPFQQYLDKRKMKIKQKKERRKKSQDDGNSGSDSDIPDDIDMNNPYFAEEFNNAEFKKKTTVKQKSLNENEQENAGLELLLLNHDEDGKKHFSLNEIQGQNSSKKKSGKRSEKKNVGNLKNDDFAINVNDDRFSALFNSHHYNIDPTNPHFKKTKNMEVLINEKFKRRNTDSEPVDSKKLKTSEKKNAELKLLVKSVKQKTSSYRNK